MGAGGRVAIKTRNQLGENYPLGGTAFALAAGRLTAFL